MRKGSAIFFGILALWFALFIFYLVMKEVKDRSNDVVTSAFKSGCDIECVVEDDDDLQKGYLVSKENGWKRDGDKFVKYDGDKFVKIDMNECKIASIEREKE